MAEDGDCWTDIQATEYGKKKTFRGFLKGQNSKLVLVCKESPTLRIEINIPFEYCLSKIENNPKRYAEQLLDSEEEEEEIQVGLSQKFQVLWRTDDASK